MGKRWQRRGPKKKKTNVYKIRCAYRKCRCQRDLKNVGNDLILARKDCDEQLCRPMRSHCARVRFCSANHRAACKVKAAKTRGPGHGTEAMDAPQFIWLWNTLKSQRSIWASVLLLLQLFCGERADAARQCRANWFQDFGNESAGSPQIKIPGGLNSKTIARSVPVPIKLAQIFHIWMHEKPLENTCGQKWPRQLFSERPEDALLFPGESKGEINYEAAISEKAYYNAIRRAARAITKERAASRRAGQEHVFEYFDLSKLATHSTKKTAVSLLKEERYSTAIISALTGTSARTLEAVYDKATFKRVRTASSQALGPVLRSIGEDQGQSCCGAPHQATAKFCYLCGKALP